ncbi:unnamed protein product [Bursaphelenchus okinawaensis]|uniref:Uncharacterized protein n=1 Tax=Bursaphelenchus okinawaensis TaxID=465554 RepID=A0A811KR52_9BILA|nr:unnamed protein product [Bursaphelenchus okinawaensis]CAG9108466.1 unnamed protein product [Bursaphelenchus okinawaensis]
MTADYSKRRKSTIKLITEDEDEIVQYNEEREQEEYVYSHDQPCAEHTVTVDFLTDDRVKEDGLRREILKDSAASNARRDQEKWEPVAKTEKTYTYHKRQNIPTPGTVQLKEMSVDYSPTNFEESRARIDAASRQENVRVKKVGDTTIVTEHRDPYSFYWQLDQFKKKEPDPPRRPPVTDYVIEEEEIQETVLSPDSHDSGVEHESQYSRPVKEERRLPAGWEKHEDPSGFSYYWHVDSGTIQRDPPRVSNKPDIPPLPPTPPIYAEESKHDPYPLPPQNPPAAPISPAPPEEPVIEEHVFKQVTTKRTVENHDESEDFIEADIGGGQRHVRFMVRSLGWTPISEEDLTTERSSQAVNKAIRDLSTGALGVLPKWGNGKELILELTDNELLLVDPDTNNVVHSEKIQFIRVWGVGRDNGRDFAYVARDKNGRQFLCHAFRCDTPARAIANTLRDICKQLMVNRPLAQSFTPTTERSERRIVKESSVAPIDEVQRVIRCHFIGVTEVPRATGIEVLNDAVDRLVRQIPTDKWILSDVSVALSNITIRDINGEQIAQCRVRYLSFLGVGQDIKHCAFIMHTSTENFLCYVFHVEPSAGLMAKTIEAACKLRYQKVLDAHINHGRSGNRARFTGEPKIICGPNTIEIEATTQSPFNGTVYVKNWRKSIGCYKSFEHAGTTNPHYSIPLSDVGKCGLELRKTADNALEVFAIVVFGFHPNFMTQNDRSFAIHCVFKQQSKDVRNKINVFKELTPNGEANGIAQIPIPKFKVISGRVPDETLQPANVVSVGDAVILVWYLSPPSNVYGLTVNECSAETLDGRKIQILTTGCTTDEVLISDVKYSERNEKAFADGMAFKFPDSEDMWIKCKINLCLQNHEHFNVSAEFQYNMCNPHANCQKREKRSTEKRNLSTDGMHTVNKKIRVMDKHTKPEVQEPIIAPAFTLNSKWCFMKNLFSVFSVLLVILYSGTLISLVFFYVNTRQNLKKLPETFSETG